MLNQHDSFSLLVESAQRGDIAEVKRLILLCNPKDDDSYALRCAASYGHSECVKLLIPVSDPKAEDSMALQVSVLYGHRDCVDLLFDVSDPHTALQAIQQTQLDFPRLDLVPPNENVRYLEEKIAHHQNSVLHNHMEILEKQDNSVVSLRKI